MEYDGISLSHLENNKYLVYLMRDDGINVKGDIVLIKNDNNMNINIMINMFILYQLLEKL
ncbi:hypothetical protein M0Q97_08905 [Candidatus Dojkabacteria bacterium]|nr:hypothetical protein [Candidatus Dojkabacteria bacterium]